jgi:hypothetical protein
MCRSDEADLLNNAGRNGWELVAVTANGIAYFKRKIASPATPARHERGRDMANLGEPAICRPGVSYVV